MLNWPGVTNLSWTNSRRLTGMRKGISSITYTYDDSGLRTMKRWTAPPRYMTATRRGIWYTKPGTTEPTICTITMMLMGLSAPSATMECGMPSGRTSRGMSLQSWIPMAMWWRSIPMTLGVKSSPSPTPVAMPSPALFTLPMSTPSGIVDITTTPKQDGIISIPLL